MIAILRDINDMRDPQQNFVRTHYIIYFFIAALLIVSVKKILELSAEPVVAKNCDFIFPESIDQTKPTIISVTANPGDSYLMSFTQKGGVINDASCLNKTAIHGIVKITHEEDVRRALSYARKNDLKVTSAGERHSMGGQSFVKDGLVLDMRAMSEITLDTEKHIVTVGSGATWAAIQQFLDVRGLSVKAMQSINIFTVGGTLSVNAHGIAHNPGQVASTVKSFRIMTANGEIKTASPTQNAELFRHALGGYGLFGVILDAQLEVVPNEMYVRRNEHMDYTHFLEYYRTHIKGNDRVGLFYGRLSVSPTSFLREAAVHVYEKTEHTGELAPLLPDTHNSFLRFVINFSKTGDIGRWFRWSLEKYVEPYVHPCVTRNQAMSQKEVCLVSRNNEMFDSMGYLKNKLADTDILQEYFIPPENMLEFVDELRAVVEKRDVNLLNVTIRIVSKDDVTALSYASDERFAFVLYFNQKLSAEESEKLKLATSDLIGVATRLGGTFYLPYQLVYSEEALRAAYPNIDLFFAAKKKIDPEELFTNTFYEKYGLQ